MESVINAPLQLSDKGTSPQSGVWGLVSKTSIHRGGAEWACWARLPREEGPELGWQIHSDCPPQGWKMVPLLGTVFLRRALRGWAGWGQVWGSSWRGAYGGGVSVWIRRGGYRHVTTNVHVYRHTHAFTLSQARLLCQYWFYLDKTAPPPHPFTPTNILSPLSWFYCPEHLGMSCICHSSL